MGGINAMRRSAKNCGRRSFSQARDCMLSGTKTLRLNFKFPTETLRFALAVECGLKTPDFGPFIRYQKQISPRSYNQVIKTSVESKSNPQFFNQNSRGKGGFDLETQIASRLPTPLGTLVETTLNQVANSGIQIRRQ
jgi:hypothetical protein